MHGDGRSAALENRLPNGEVMHRTVHRSRDGHGTLCRIDGLACAAWIWASIEHRILAILPVRIAANDMAGRRVAKVTARPAAVLCAEGFRDTV